MKIDHLVMTVGNIEETCGFYEKILGMRVVTLRDGRKELHFGDQKIKIYGTEKRRDPEPLNPAPGSLDICLVTSIALCRVVEHLDSFGIEIIRGPLRRMGSMGPIESIYFRDPDGNLIEMANYVGDMG
jgi:catechol 2,3-dioxygenase-like lactoylglutathione lyase family enzyme